jgi:hypothetical protein
MRTFCIYNLLHWHNFNISDPVCKYLLHISPREVLSHDYIVILVHYIFKAWVGNHQYIYSIFFKSTNYDFTKSPYTTNVKYNLHSRPFCGNLLTYKCSCHLRNIEIMSMEMWIRDTFICRIKAQIWISENWTVFPILWRHEQVIRLRTSRSTWFHSFIMTVKWYNILYQTSFLCFVCVFVLVFVFCCFLLLLTTWKKNYNIEVYCIYKMYV